MNECTLPELDYSQFFRTQIHKHRHESGATPILGTSHSPPYIMTCCHPRLSPSKNATPLSPDIITCCLSTSLTFFVCFWWGKGGLSLLWEYYWAYTECPESVFVYNKYWPLESEVQAFTNTDTKVLAHGGGFQVAGLCGFFSPGHLSCRPQWCLWRRKSCMEKGEKMLSP